MVQAPIGSLLEALQEPADTALDQMQTVVAETFGLIQQAIGVINDDLLGMQWDQIPLLDDLYAKYVDPDDSLTALSVMALAIALPADAVYFTAFDRHPFETDEDLANFQAAFTAEWLLQQSGLVPAGTTKRVEIPQETRQVFSQVLGSLLTASYVVLSYTHRIQDVASATEQPVQLVRVVGVVAAWIR